MDSKAPGLDFAVIGHQESWSAISSFINGIRGDDRKLDEQTIKSVFSYMPPRDLFRVKVRSANGQTVTGAYIETFIDPDKLVNGSAAANIRKVAAAMQYAIKLGARIVTLGGFCSIVLEGNIDIVGQSATKFTTGNTLTAAFVVKGIELAATQRRVDLASSNLLIVGATGDIGMAVTHYFKGKVKSLLVAARNAVRLEKLAMSLRKEGHEVGSATDYRVLLPEANVIVLVSSSTSLSLEGCREDALVCDAGYPKNTEVAFHPVCPTIFHGGMGQVKAGYEFLPDYRSTFYRYPLPDVSHGCILEAIVLAFEKAFTSYSAGKGNISVASMEEIFSWSCRNGITLAPFYNSHGLWPNVQTANG